MAEEYSMQYNLNKTSEGAIRTPRIRIISPFLFSGLEQGHEQDKIERKLAVFGEVFADEAIGVIKLLFHNVLADAHPGRDLVKGKVFFGAEEEDLFAFGRQLPDGFAKQGMGLAVVDLVPGILAVRSLASGGLYLAGYPKADLFPVDMIDQLIFGGAEEIGFEGLDFTKGSPLLPNFEKNVLGDLFGGVFGGGEKKNILHKGVEVLRIQDSVGMPVTLGQGTEK